MPSPLCPKLSKALAGLLFVLFAFGCAQVTTQYKGEYYLVNDRYAEGIEYFQAQLKQNPNEPSTHYYLGRMYLATNKYEQGLNHIEQAIALDPGNADYYFWQGVAYWALMNFEKERESYEQALRLDDKHVQAHVYLGHHLMDKGRVEEALGEYDTAVALDRYNPDALYNRALALRKLGRAKQETEAWKTYLGFYPDGEFARNAADYLNYRGNFAYRNYQIGIRRVTLERIRFKQDSAQIEQSSKPSLRVIGSIMTNNKRIVLEIVGFQDDDKNLAQARADSVREYILDQYPEVSPDRLKTRAVSRPERIAVGDKEYLLNGSILFVTLAL